MVIVLLLMGSNLIAMGPEMYLPLKKKYYHQKITNQLFKLKIQQEKQEQEKIVKKKESEARKKQQAEQVRYANYEDYKRRFPTKEEAV